MLVVSPIRSRWVIIHPVQAVVKGEILAFQAYFSLISVIEEVRFKLSGNRVLKTSRIY